MGFEQIIASMPMGLERSLARILTYHTGELHSIEREALLQELRRQPGLHDVEDRQMRLAIQSLRNQGVRICHNERREINAPLGRVVIVFGYYLAETEGEYQEFRQRYGSYARTIWQTIKAMDEMKPILTSTGELEPPPETAIQESLL